MALGAAVDTKRPLKVVKEDGETTLVKSIANPTVYYKQGSAQESVSPTLNDGSLAKGETLTVSQNTSLIAKEAGAQVEIFTKPSPVSFSEEVITVVEAGKFNVKNPAYAGGAKGDGTTDDTAAFKAAIEAVKAAGGGTLLVPAGRYPVKEILIEQASGEAPVNIEGVGRRATEIFKNVTGNTPVITVKTTTASEFTSNTAIRHITVANKGAEGVGMLLERLAWGRVVDCELISCSVGIEGKGLISYSLEDLIIFNGCTKGIVLTRSTAVSTVGSNSVSVRRSVISNCKTTGLEADYCPQLLLDTLDLEKNGEAGKPLTGAIKIGTHVKSEFGVGQVIIRNLWAEENFGRTLNHESGELRMHDCLSFATDEATTTTEGRDVFIPTAATEVGRVVIADCEFPTNVASKNQIVIEPAAIVGEISNPTFSQLYSVPTGVLVKQDSYYTNPLRFATNALAAATALETITQGLCLTGGNIIVRTAGKGIAVHEGTDCKQGLTAAMVSGKVVVANKSVTASSRIILTRQDGGTNPGAVYVSARVAGTSFTVLSTSGTDTGEVAYQIFEPSEI